MESDALKAINSLVVHNPFSMGENIVENIRLISNNNTRIFFNTALRMKIKSLMCLRALVQLYFTIYSSLYSGLMKIFILQKKKKQYQKSWCERMKFLLVFTLVVFMWNNVQAKVMKSDYFTNYIGFLSWEFQMRTGPRVILTPSWYDLWHLVDNQCNRYNDHWNKFTRKGSWITPLTSENLKVVYFLRPMEVDFSMNDDNYETFWLFHFVQMIIKNVTSQHTVSKSRQDVFRWP